MLSSHSFFFFFFLKLDHTVYILAHVNVVCWTLMPGFQVKHYRSSEITTDSKIGSWWVEETGYVQVRLCSQTASNHLDGSCDWSVRKSFHEESLSRDTDAQSSNIRQQFFTRRSGRSWRWVVLEPGGSCSWRPVQGHLKACPRSPPWTVYVY